MDKLIVDNLRNGDFFADALLAMPPADQLAQVSLRLVESWQCQRQLRVACAHTACSASLLDAALLQVVCGGCLHAFERTACSASVLSHTFSSAGVQSAARGGVALHGRVHGCHHRARADELRLLRAGR